MPVPTATSFIGVTRELTRGLALAPVAYVPVTSFDSPNDVENYAEDKGYRGAPVEVYDELPTQAWAEPSYGGNVHVDTVGYWLTALFGERATTGPTSTVYTHIFTALNSGDFQPPSLCITDYNGVDTRQIPGFLVSEFALQMTATGLLTYSVKGMGFKSSTTTKPTPAYTAEPAKPGWKALATIGGSAAQIVQEASLTIRRAVEVIPRIGQQDPYRIWGGALSVEGSMNLVFESATELNRYLNGTNVVVSLGFSEGAGATVRGISVTMSKALYTSGKPVRGKSYAELPINFKGVANTTDVGASGGFGPCTVTLWNLITTY